VDFDLIHKREKEESKGKMVYVYSEVTLMAGALFYLDVILGLDKFNSCEMYAQ
jgi:hypothetical protein